MAFTINAGEVLRARLSAEDAETYLQKLSERQTENVSFEVLESNFKRVTTSRYLGMHVWPVPLWLLLAFLQTSYSIRKKNLLAHRWAGRLFLAISAYMTVSISLMLITGEELFGQRDVPFDWQRPDKFFTIRLASILQTIWWTYCIYNVYTTAKNKSIKRHRYWAVHFVASGFSVGIFRVVFAAYTAFYHGIGSEAALSKQTLQALVGYLGWGSIAGTTLVVEVWSRYLDTLGGAPGSRAKQN